MPVDQVDRSVFEMIIQGQMRAHINQQTKKVDFIDDQDQSNAMIGKLEEQNMRILALMEKATEMNIDIRTAPEFIQQQLLKESQQLEHDRTMAANSAGDYDMF